MTFEEAVIAKKEIGDKVVISGIVCEIFVVPCADRDFDMYMENYLQSKFNDESAKIYSKDSKFKLYAFYQYLNGFLQKEFKR